MGTGEASQPEADNSGAPSLGMEEGVSRALSEASELCGVEDPPSEPFRSKYKAREILVEAKRKAAAVAWEVRKGHNARFRVVETEPRFSTSTVAGRFGPCPVLVLSTNQLHGIYTNPRCGVFKSRTFWRRAARVNKRLQRFAQEKQQCRLPLQEASIVGGFAPLFFSWM